MSFSSAYASALSWLRLATATNSLRGDRYIGPTMATLIQAVDLIFRLSPPKYIGNFRRPLGRLRIARSEMYVLN